MPGKINLRILDIGIKLQFDSNCCLPINDSLKKFVRVSEENCLSSIRINFVEEPLLFRGTNENLSQTWNGNSSISMHEAEGGVVLKYGSGQFHADPEFTHVRVWSPYDREISIQRDGFPNFNGDPALRLILWGYASMKNFCYLHGALNVLDGQYILFMGKSGVGKTTLSNLACELGATCLTEEDPFLSWKEGKPFVYGTPWPGAKGPENQTSGKLAAVFFLRHAQKNQINRLNSNFAGRNLLQNTRVFKWLPQVVPNAIELIDKVSKSVPSYDFGFVPDRRAIDVIRSVL